MEINAINMELDPLSSEIIQNILASDPIQEKINGSAHAALNYLHAMYTMKTRAAAYSLEVDGKIYRVVVNFSDAQLPFAIETIQCFDGKSL